MNICILGELGDLASVYVGWQARQRGAQVLELAEQNFGIDWSYELDDQRPTEGTLTVKDRKFRLNELDGIFVRFCPNPALPEGLKLEGVGRNAFVGERRYALQHFLESVTCPVVNRPSAGRSNGSKPYQMALLERSGFRVPRWLATNHPKMAARFLNRCGDGCIYKASSGLRSEVKKVDEQLWSRLESGTTPVVLQEYIPGRDVRVHTVGCRSFPTQVTGGSGVDYRYQSDGTHYSPTEVPPEIEARCFDFARNEGSILAGFDFRVTEAGEWYCLEMNPVPSFLPYEIAANQPVASAVLDLLLKADA